MSRAGPVTAPRWAPLQYMAPEQIRDAKNVDARADVFSLGAVLYELVTGVRCFSGSDTLDVLNRVAGGVYTPLLELVPEAPARYAEAIEAALHVDADERVPTVTALKELWFGSVMPVVAGPWGKELLSQAEGMGSGGTSTQDFLRESFSSAGRSQQGRHPAPTAVPFTQAPPADALTVAAPQTMALDDLSPDFYVGAPPRRPATLDAHGDPHPEVASVDFGAPTVSAETIDPMSFPGAAPDTVHERTGQPPVVRAAGAPSTTTWKIRVALAAAGIALLGVALGWAGLYGLQYTALNPVADLPEIDVDSPQDPAGRDPEVRTDMSAAPPPTATEVPRPSTPSPAPEDRTPEHSTPTDPPPHMAPEPMEDPTDAVASVDPTPKEAMPAPVVTVDAPGVTVVLRDPTGRPVPLEAIQAGEYELFVFWEPRVATAVQRVYIAAGARWHIKCVPSQLRCSMTQP